jgi:hypothetical protein
VPVPTTFLFQWFVTWVILAVVFFVAADSIQRFLYETVVEKLAWRVLAVTPILAAVLVAWPLPFQEMFFSLSRMLLQVVLWFLACWLGLRFLLPHAVAAGILAVMTIAPVASSSVESLTNKLFEPAAATGQIAPSPLLATLEPNEDCFRSTAAQWENRNATNSRSLLGHTWM